MERKYLSDRINEVIFLIEASADDAVAFLEHYNIAECKIYSSAPQIKHCEEYYAELSAKLNKHKQKHEINTHTLEKFSHLVKEQLQESSLPCRTGWCMQI